jgi:hypothetical protein
MVPQQAHYQFRWLKVFRAHLDLSICDLLSAICYWLLSPAATNSCWSVLVRPSAVLRLASDEQELVPTGMFLYE